MIAAYAACGVEYATNATSPPTLGSAASPPSVDAVLPADDAAGAASLAVASSSSSPPQAASVRVMTAAVARARARIPRKLIDMVIFLHGGVGQPQHGRARVDCVHDEVGVAIR